MRTILLGISCALISLSALCASSATFACSFALQYESKLERDVVSISNADRIALASLLITVRSSVANDGPVVIYGYSDERERNAIVVALSRANAVRAYLLDLGVSKDRIHVESKIWRRDSAVPAGKRNQIEVEFIPACSPGACENPCGIALPVQEQ
ncbi:OmpA family protein [Burkholderia pyrrocinia]|uniref:OmpA family protein n=1 Tax=Burkholderia pyrrocinia TaxID=60550 RepID=UPI0015750AA2|nr:OmpA family protein [Burkholderia pyrrocinia]QVN17747.1 OmpA family protein [Burkholderia pyrrocinia]